MHLVLKIKVSSLTSEGLSGKIVIDFHVSHTRGSIGTIQIRQTEGLPSLIFMFRREHFFRPPFSTQKNDWSKSNHPSNFTVQNVQMTHEPVGNRLPYYDVDGDDAKAIATLCLTLVSRVSCQSNRKEITSCLHCTVQLPPPM